MSREERFSPVFRQQAYVRLKLLDKKYENQLTT